VTHLVALTARPFVRVKRDGSRRFVVHLRFADDRSFAPDFCTHVGAMEAARLFALIHPLEWTASR
jgi:hypothetical protein